MAEVAADTVDGQGVRGGTDNPSYQLPFFKALARVACNNERHATHGGGREMRRPHLRMCERHYAHLTQSYSDQAIEAGAPVFGVVQPSNLVQMKKESK